MRCWRCWDASGERTRRAAGRTLMREIAWTPVWDPERAGWGVELVRLGAGSASSSAILFDDVGAPFDMSWRIEWDERWCVRSVDVRTLRDATVRSLVLTSDGRGTWTGPAGERTDLAGILDVDLWPTPFTNSFPIRRLGLGAGERAALRVVFIEAPELAVSVAEQAYSRVGAETYLFESTADGFRAELTVDPDGVVLDYPGLFRRLV